MTLAKRIQDLRKQADLSLDELAAKATISKTYLWELENDEKDEKKPSAEILLKIANALDTTIGTLLGVPTIRIDHNEVEISPSLKEFSQRMESAGTPLSHENLKELASIKFRGAQPKTADEWHQLYFVLTRN